MKKWTWGLLSMLCLGNIEAHAVVPQTEGEFKAALEKLHTDLIGSTTFSGLCNVLNDAKDIQACAVVPEAFEIVLINVLEGIEHAGSMLDEEKFAQRKGKLEAFFEKPTAEMANFIESEPYKKALELAEVVGVGGVWPFSPSYVLESFLASDAEGSDAEGSKAGSPSCSSEEISKSEGKEKAPETKSEPIVAQSSDVQKEESKPEVVVAQSSDAQKEESKPEVVVAQSSDAQKEESKPEVVAVQPTSQALVETTENVSTTVETLVATVEKQKDTEVTIDQLGENVQIAGNASGSVAKVSPSKETTVSEVIASSSVAKEEARLIGPETKEKAEAEAKAKAQEQDQDQNQDQVRVLSPKVSKSSEALEDKQQN